MSLSIGKLKTKLMRDYYKYFSKYSKGEKPERKVAWVSSFAPVEILESLDVLYYYPESYAAVIAASGKEQEMFEESNRNFLSLDCCSYSCCIEGSILQMNGPRGELPAPDILIATNNQCNTLPGWWNVLAQKYHVPLIILDYPGEIENEKMAYEYVLVQHYNLISVLQKLTGNMLDVTLLNEIIDYSEKSVSAWKKVISYLVSKEIKPTLLFDDINYLITARCKSETSELYNMMCEEFFEKEDVNDERIPVFWVGYPLWYHPQRYLEEELAEFRVVGSNYITWWNLNYQGEDVFERLYNAYNFTFLNLSQKTRNIRLRECIKYTGAACAIVLHNKSCKCDFVSARDLDIPQAEIDMDMIDRNYMDIKKAQKQIQLLKEML